MKHRDDIDGLRVVAVLPILLFHAGVSTLAGGFVGVDIFFVISGFLITTIIMREMEDGRFSILDFYHRRVVRIFPALVALLVAVVGLGCVLLLSEELTSLATSAAATMIFMSNIYFWTDADYFGGAAEAKPLLHTWSLGVEEQFYLFYPVILILLRRYFPHRVSFAILVITAASFVASVVFSAARPTTAFYLLPFRAWELGFGALVALGMLPALSSRRSRDVASVIGLALIAIGVLVVRPGNAFPAPLALLPCGGAVLLIQYGREAITARLLSWRPVRWIGAISYSLYLWHWPIIVYYRLQNGMELSFTATILLVAASFAAAALSYYLVEQPFLRRYRHRAVRPVLAVGATSLAAVAVGSVLVGVQADAIVRAPDAVRKISAFSEYRDLPQYDYQFRKGPCFVGEDQVFDVGACLKMRPDKTNVVLLGDSHAAQYWRALSLRFPDHNVMQATASGCRPTIALQGRARCTQIVNLVLNSVTDRPGLTGVILGGRWQQVDLPSLVQTVRMLRSKGLTVTVIGPTVEYDGEMPRILAKAMLERDMGKVARRRLRDRERLDRLMRGPLEQTGARYVSAVDIECRGGCKLFDSSGGPTHFDYGHLTLAGSQDIVSQINTL